MRRREFLRGATITGAGLLGGHTRAANAEAPPETTRIRLLQIAGICIAPQYIAEDLLRAEGFTDVQYVKKEGTSALLYKTLATAEVDINVAFASPFIIAVEAGDPIVLLGGVHVGCYELFGGDRVRAIRDLRGRKVSIPGRGSAHHVFLSTMAAYVGVDPGKDIDWVEQPPAEGKQSLAEGKVDAFLGFPPDPQEMRARKIGRVVVSSANDRPWSQYFCCMLGGNREFVRKHPVATKRAMRAILKAANLCATEPDRAARFLVDRGFTQSYEYALQTMRDLPYNRWREYDPADSVRFYALRLHEAGMIKSSPQKILAQGTDWRAFEELKKELKG